MYPLNYAIPCELKIPVERSKGVKTKATKGRREKRNEEGGGRESHNGNRRPKAGKLFVFFEICGGGFSRLRTEKLVRKVRNEGRI